MDEWYEKQLWPCMIWLVVLCVTSFVISFSHFWISVSFFIFGLIPISLLYFIYKNEAYLDNENGRSHTSKVL